MKRLHVHLNVAELDNSIEFYRTLFAAEPTVVKYDYAKWELDEPAVNFAISSGGKPGLQHLGIQVQSNTELADLYQRISPAESNKLDEGETTCCYARSVKTWVSDPQNIPWELFQTIGEADTFHTPENQANNASCCGISSCN